MNPELLQAYYWLSSAIAQAFAALIALTAMFYIYRKRLLQDRIKEVCNEGRNILSYLHTLKSTLDERREMAIIQMMGYNLTPGASIIEDLSRLAESNIEPVIEMKLLSTIKLTLRKYDKMIKNNHLFQTLIITAILPSASTMLTGIAALLISTKICSDGWGFVIMIFESCLAALALGWTVFVVIKMLGEPKEPEAEPSPQPSPKGRG